MGYLTFFAPFGHLPWLGLGLVIYFVIYFAQNNVNSKAEKH